MIIGVSGTPGCGKTTLAKQLSEELSYTYIDVTEFIKTHNLSDEFDEQTQSYVVDITTLEKKLKDNLDPKTTYIIDSHMAQDLLFIDKLVVCSCQLDVLRERLLKRKYSEEKIRENLDAEIFDVCYIDGIENAIDTIKIDCTKPLDKEKKKELISFLI